ncbi:MAG: hypothetical protein HQL69_17065 [Magnetococcales bacterium]|nr:hypothetical protein [Magnetococcales bacterium]
MAYIVIKKIRNKYGNIYPYFYLQQTYRVGKQVKTRSQYIGPAGGHIGKGTIAAVNHVLEDQAVENKGAPKAIRRVLKDFEGTTDATVDAIKGAITASLHLAEAPGTQAAGNQERAPVQNRVAQSLEKPPRKMPPGKVIQATKETKSLIKAWKDWKKKRPLPRQVHAGPPSLKVKVNLEKYAISHNAMKRDLGNALKILKNIGVNTTSFPNIQLQHGKTVQYYKKALSSTIAVTLPRWGKGNRDKFRHAYRKAISRSSLELLEAQKPELGLHIKSQFDASFRATNDALNAYLCNSNDPHSWSKVIALKWFGYMNHVYKSKVSPEKLGLIQYGSRKDWREEFVSIHAEIQRKGYSAIIKKAEKEIFLAKNEESLAVREKTIWKSRRRKRMNRARARMNANEELIRKVRIVRHAFS